MIRRCFVHCSAGCNPYENLATEQTLLERVGEQECILYLWQNARTVVIGRNQNPWKECRTTLLREEGGHLARRLSGGGAVFHDLGNLNFTFLLRQSDYDLSRQLSVIETACRSLGIPAERSGRNDLLADGRKFSGNAFYQHNGAAYHHGTLMVDVDLDMVERYLSPSKAKLLTKGVDSVRSRVVNLKEFVPNLTVDVLRSALIRSFGEIYGQGKSDCLPEVKASQVFFTAEEQTKIHMLTHQYGDDTWLYGQRLPFTLNMEERFSWGGVELQLQVDRGVIQNAKVYTDAMDETLSHRMENALIHCPFRWDALHRAMEGADLSQQQKHAILSMLTKAI